MVTPAAERTAVPHLVASHGMSERRACKTIGMCRMTLRYETVRPDDAALRARTIVDDCTRECLALVADTSLGGFGWPENWIGLLSAAANRR